MTITTSIMSSRKVEPGKTNPLNIFSYTQIYVFAGCWDVAGTGTAAKNVDST